MSTSGFRSLSVFFFHWPSISSVPISQAHQSSAYSINSKILCCHRHSQWFSLQDSKGIEQQTTAWPHQPLWQKLDKKYLMDNIFGIFTSISPSHPSKVDSQNLNICHRSFSTCLSKISFFFAGTEDKAVFPGSTIFISFMFIFCWTSNSFYLHFYHIHNFLKRNQLLFISGYAKKSFENLTTIIL